MKNKKILIFMPSIEGGGVEKNLFIISNFLTKKFDQVGLITISKKFASKFDKSINFISTKSFFWDKMSRRIKYLIAILLLIKEILKDRNLIVFSFQANIYCIIICKIFFIKVITRSNSAPVGWSRNIIKKNLFKFFLHQSDKIIVNSYEFKKDLKNEFNVNAVTIYNPLNFKEILTNSRKKSSKIFRNKKDLKIINIGRFTDQKDQMTLLRALNLIKNEIKFSAVLVGKGVLKDQLRNYIKKNKMNNCVKLNNFVENPFPLIKQSDIFILSSKFEGLPNVLLEALVLKKIIISSKCHTGPKEILLNGKGGLLFQVGDYKKLASLIKYFNKNKKTSTIKKLLKNSYASLDRFDLNKNLEKYVSLIKSVR